MSRAVHVQCTASMPASVARMQHNTFGFTYYRSTARYQTWPGMLWTGRRCRQQWSMLTRLFPLDCFARRSRDCGSGLHSGDLQNYTEHRQVRCRYERPECSANKTLSQRRMFLCAAALYSFRCVMKLLLWQPYTCTVRIRWINYWILSVLLKTSCCTHLYNSFTVQLKGWLYESAWRCLIDPVGVDAARRRMRMSGRQ